MKKRTDGRYQLSVFIGHREDGTRKQKVVYGKTQNEVKQKANELRALYNMGIEVDNDITVADWAAMWMDIYKKGISYNTHEMYRYALKNHIIPKLGDLELRKVKTVQIQQIINDGYKEGLTKTLTNIKLTLSQMFQQAIINEIVLKNPCLGVKIPKTEKPQKRALTGEEIDKISRLELEPKVKVFVYLLLHTGMRRGEVLALTKDDINLTAEEISVKKTLIFKGNHSEIKDNPKTQAGIRTIPIIKPLEPLLKEYLPSVGYYLFTTQKNEIMTQTSYNRMWEKFKKAYGETDITPHIFRHHFATSLYYAGVDIKSAQSILGHKSINVTMDIYTHLDKQKNNETKNKLNNYFS